MNNDNGRTEPASETACKTDNFKFACPYCGQPLEAEADWAGTECECPRCGKAITVPQPPRPKPLITVVGKPEQTRPLESSQGKGRNPAWWKTVPKWAHGVAGAAMLAIICLAVALSISVKRASSDGNRHTEGNNPVAVSNGGKNDEKPAPPPRPDLKPLSKDQESAEWIKSCKEADWEEVMRFPVKIKGKPLYVKGKVTGVKLSKEFEGYNHIGNVWIDQEVDVGNADGWQRAEWLIQYDDERTAMPEGNILNGDYVIVLGTFQRIYEWKGKNAFNAEVSGKEPVLFARVIANAPEDIVEMFDVDVDDDDDDEDDSEAMSNSLTQDQRRGIGNTLNFLSTIEFYAARTVKKLFGTADGTVTDVLKSVAGIVLANKLENEKGWNDCPRELQNAIKKVAIARVMANMAEVIKKHGTATVKSVLERYKINDDYKKYFTEVTNKEESAIFQEKMVSEFQFKMSVANYGLEDEYLTSLTATPLDSVTVEIADIAKNKSTEADDEMPLTHDQFTRREALRRDFQHNYSHVKFNETNGKWEPVDGYGLPSKLQLENAAVVVAWEEYQRRLNKDESPLTHDQFTRREAVNVKRNFQYNYSHVRFNEANGKWEPVDGYGLPSELQKENAAVEVAWEEYQWKLKAKP